MLRNFVIQTSRHCTSTAPKISVPYAIKRTPTELLEALNSTVGVDKTAPHFAFIDDPITIPSTRLNKKVYFQAKELGKRAARHLASEWPTLFMYDIDEPRLPVFRPTHPLSMIPFEGTEEELIKMIEAREIKTAVECYEKIRANGVNVSDKVQMDLFKLIVYYNENDIPYQDIEKFPALRDFYSDKLVPSWNGQGLAELLFETIKKTPETYSIMIAGMCKHVSSYSFKRAKELYEEMLENNMVPCIEAFNGLISISQNEKALKYLKEIDKYKIQPTVDTMNACIIAAPKIDKMASRLDFIQKLILEFRFANVKANLYTYHLIINYLTPKMDKKKPEDYKSVISVLDQIVTNLEMVNEIKIENCSDSEFFKTAMNVAADANNSKLVERIEKIYSDKKNTVKFVNFQDEDSYYYKYLIYNIIKLPLPELEKLYKELVPRVCGVYAGSLRLLMNRLLSAPRWSFIKRVVEDSIAINLLAQQGFSNELRKLLLSVDVHSLPSEDFLDYRETLSHCLDLWSEILQYNKSAVSKGVNFLPNIDDEFITVTKKAFSKYVN
uniref:Small ribosomal subunit protein mS39 n=1 Tax=Strongyloides papillosus TaxID=174720 RepID=A0A0N5BX94_STREA